MVFLHEFAKYLLGKERTQLLTPKEEVDNIPYQKKYNMVIPEIKMSSKTLSNLSREQETTNSF